MNRRWRAVALVVAAVHTVSACGVPSDQGVRVTEAADVPFGLLDTVPTSRADATSTTVGRETDSFTAYFVRSGQLVAVPTVLDAPVGPDDALDALLTGPTDDDVVRGLRTALVGTNLVRSASSTAGVASVDLGEDFGALAPREQRLGLGQIVLTLTTLRGIGSVDFLVLGKRAEVRIGDNSLVPGPVSRDQYMVLLAP